jgi:uncharacterized protein (TIGR02646 family)
MAQNLAKYKEEIRFHFSLPPEERRRRRAPFNAKVIMGDPDVHEALYKVFAGKCAYCESHVGRRGTISHFRPVSAAASSHSDKSSPDHYAWLAYEWRNLLFTCEECDRMKHNLFPVDGPRALPLTTWSEAVQAEESLLLDPCVDEPRRHLGFTADGSVYPLTTRGLVTIKVLDLNRSTLQRERRDEFKRLLSIPQQHLQRGAGELLERQYPHAGALRIFVFALCRTVARMNGIAMPFNHNNLAASLFAARSMVSDSKWSEVIQNVDDSHASPDRWRQPDVDQNVDLQRNLKRDQPWLESIHIDHFKGIERLDLELTKRRGTRSDLAPCAVLLGENSVGKSSLLQAVAITLMEARDRKALKLDPEDFLSREEGNWQLTRAGMANVTLRFTDGAQARLRYEASGRASFEIKSDFPCIILAYGSRRFFVERGAKRKGGHLNKTLFDPLATLPDPGIWLRTVDEHTFDAVARAMREVLALRKDDSIFRTEHGNVLVRAHGRESPVERMSDGYRSLFAMAVDIMRNMLETWDNLEYARGIVLIDEIETHLHPRWKMQVMPALRSAMPQVQFIATTHDPLCLRGIKNGEVHVLYRDDHGRVRLVNDLPDIETLRAEQILTSDYFGLWTTADVEQETVLMRLAALGGRPENELNVRERRERDELLRQFEGLPVIGSSPDRQILAEAMTRHLRNLEAMPIGERAAVREDAIDQIVGVLERAMRP